ncbi:hypothetical protein NPIL_551671, partial [Nephila pilipes]
DSLVPLQFPSMPGWQEPGFRAASDPVPNTIPSFRIRSNLTHNQSRTTCRNSCEWPIK